MLIKEILAQAKTQRVVPVSFEFFPPKADKGWGKLQSTIQELLPLHPAYVSVTYGAGGSTRENTHQLVTNIQRENQLEVVAHLTCEGSTHAEIAEILDSYANEGVMNILALKGDISQNNSGPLSDFAHAVDLVQFIKTRHPAMGVAAAAFPEGHPATPNRLKEMDYLKAKVDAGVDYLVTQLFFDNHDFLDFRERCRLSGIEVPLIAGIMPVTTRGGMERMAELASGSRFPAPLLKALARAKDDDAVAKVGIHWATQQISDLMNQGVDGVHLYTLNNSSASVEICRSLGLHRF